MKTTEPLDYLGCPIHEGDTVAYPVRRGKDMYMRKMRIFKIQAILTLDAPIYKLFGTNDAGRQVIVEKTDRTIVVA
jgi:hypothetical protein